MANQRLVLVDMICSPPTDSKRQLNVHAQHMGWQGQYKQKKMFLGLTVSTYPPRLVGPQDIGVNSPQRGAGSGQRTRANEPRGVQVAKTGENGKEKTTPTQTGKQIGIFFEKKKNAMGLLNQDQKKGQSHRQSNSR